MGKHRRPSRAARVSANVAGIATLTAAGVVAGVAAPAFAASDDSRGPEDTGLTQAVVISDVMADNVGAQAETQRSAADEAAARLQAEETAQKKASDAKERHAEAERKIKEEREAKERAARDEERKRLGTYVSPIDGSYVSTSYKASSGLWSSGSHTGIDLHAETGTSVHAVAAGTIVEAGWGGAYGNNVVIKHNDGTYTQYGHLSSIDVSVGQTVTPGQQIGLSGATGNVTGPHLHFEARTAATYGSDIDPIAYMSAHGVSL
ncbi:peptidoglycan DD-metalloendopeptidase family protein [Streptomyces triculaminicus]|uniref:Peptidoglycan DD-metalloendopeptidase family protein n=2 Tax=Streptomyces TaxID=1883 RepID=A0A939FPI1_9ACTN|nr:MULTISPECIES: M23 family metallopeptidase [Streptomyces]MBO0655433.1 peptidoglycan DD-metalloendopeptidase family protein [Streptomyces triculaminicus]QSY50729.1 peptidoglycan DD-metalloendopeptidase family protein [Streptomyces griseocarneus]